MGRGGRRLSRHDQPFPLAYARCRQAEALAAAGSTDTAEVAAGEAGELAGRMGAAPLLGEIEALIRRARLRISANATHPGPDSSPRRPCRCRRPVRIDPARARGAPTRRRRLLQQPDRAGAVHLPRDSKRPRLEHPVQARGRHPGAGGRTRPPSRPRLRPATGIAQDLEGHVSQPRPAISAIAGARRLHRPDVPGGGLDGMLGACSFHVTHSAAARSGRPPVSASPSPHLAVSPRAATGSTTWPCWRSSSTGPTRRRGWRSPRPPASCRSSCSARSAASSPTGMTAGG